ncbi:hypothetical protein BX661DRAFT_170969 [Kickxella alabastrina]|uniref:uncharacterized protein n=1 Tax=Kickxella alabastrina TaxID=61397 RepID=UPI00221F525E|nr:uncharacterized protein BX661DRAFT_170969 [Kickxella alabastrina]KAI7827734.1 hypothetical protein BX661DRAFT_170969 [Kickxella alabastrina]
MVGGPDEDEHYEVRELGHPNKAHRKMPSTADIEAAEAEALFDTQNEDEDTRKVPSNITGARASARATAVTIQKTAGDEDGTRRNKYRNIGHPEHNDSIRATLNERLLAQSTPLKTEGKTMIEQVQQSKARAVEILQAMDDEALLELPIEEYIVDVNSSYNEADPKLLFPKLRAAWTTEEDRLLRVGVRVYGPNTESWPRIAMLVPGRTNKSCRKRWFHSLDPTLHKGPWTTAEDDLLRTRVDQFPSQWSRVAEGIPGRTDDQCAKRWRESLDPEIDRGKWRPEEDLLLLAKFEEFGTQWQKMRHFSAAGRVCTAATGGGRSSASSRRRRRSPDPLPPTS